jgi:hypothetical protein
MFVNVNILYAFFYFILSYFLGDVDLYMDS